MRDSVEFINISKMEDNEDLFTWVAPGKSLATYTLDIISTKSILISSNIFYQTKRKNLKISFYSNGKIRIIVASKENIQYQMQEALIEYLLEEFMEFYGTIIENFSGLSGDTFTGFSDIVYESMKKVNSLVKFVRVPCKACNENISVCIKKSLIEKSKDFPVSIVYVHNAHALLVYIDRAFKARGAEIVNLSG